MASSNQSMFRTEALEYRLRTQGQRQTEVSYPRWMTRRVAIMLWIVLGLLAISGAAACFVEIPVTEAGLAIVRGETHGRSDRVTITVLMPVDYGQTRHQDANARLFFGTRETAFEGALIKVAPDPLAISQVEQQLGLPASSLAMLEEPVWLVEIGVDPAFANTLVPGTTGRAELPAGSRYAGTFLPLVGRFFGSIS